MVLVSALVALLPVQPLVFVEEAKVAAPVLTLGDVADVATLPVALRKDAEKLVLMKLPASRASLTLSAADVAAKARSLIPSLTPWVEGATGNILIHRRSADPRRIIAIASGPDGITKDDSVRVRIASGPFTIEREGRALSNAKNGDRLFIRTEDRKALSAMCCGE
jgi:hypothetical protein